MVEAGLKNKVMSEHCCDAAICWN